MQPGVAFDITISASTPGDDSATGLVAHKGKVQCSIVICDPELGMVGGGFSLPWEFLDKPRVDDSVLPLSIM